MCKVILLLRVKKIKEKDYVEIYLGFINIFSKDLVF